MLLACICGVLVLLAVWRLGRHERPLNRSERRRLRRLYEATRRESILPFE